MLCIHLQLLVSSNFLWKFQINMAQSFIRWWLWEDTLSSLERINLKIFLRTTNSVLSFSQSTKPYVLVPALEVVNHYLQRFSLFHKKQPTFSHVKSLWKILSENEPKSFFIRAPDFSRHYEHSLHPGLFDNICLYDHTALNYPVLCDKVRSRYLSPIGGGEMRWKQFLKLWVKVSTQTIL